MEQVIHNLYIGNAEDAKNILVTGGFAVVSVGTEFAEEKHLDPTCSLKNTSQCPWKTVSIWDGRPKEIVPHLKGVWAFVDENIKDRPVLIHCRAGISRSVSILWSYLIYCGERPLDAYLTIKRVRPIVNPYSTFLEEILHSFYFKNSEAARIVKQISDVDKMFEKKALAYCSK